MVEINILCTLVVATIFALVCGIIGKKAGHGKAGAVIGLILGVFVDVFIGCLPVAR